MNEHANSDNGNPEPDRFEQLMGEVLGQESELDPDELGLLLAAGEQEGDLEEGEFVGLQRLAQTLESAGTRDALAQASVTPEEEAKALKAWRAVVLNDDSDVEVSGPTPSPWWKRHSSLVAMAAAALLLAAFLAGRMGSSPKTHPSEEASTPGGTLGSDPNAPELSPSLERSKTGDWVIALDPVPADVRSVTRDLVLEAEILGSDGTWRSQAFATPKYAPGSVRWTWKSDARAKETPAKELRFRIRQQAPAGRQSWTSDWFVGNKALSTQ